MKAALAGGVGFSVLGRNSAAQAFPNPPNVIRPRNPSAPPKLLSGTKSVLVVGGGIAGLSAALELAERGFRVTVCEADSVLGGRLATRTVSNAAGTFAVEHGLHMWFDNYHVFADIRKRLGVESFFREYNKIHFVFRDYKPEVLESSPPIYPVNLANLLVRSPNLNVLDALPQLRSMVDVMFFNYDKLWDKFDTLTFGEWVKRTGVSKKFYDILLEPAASVTLNDPMRISAAEMILYMHYYFIGQPRAMNRTIATTDHGTCVINPWAERLTSLGVRIKTGRPVGGLRLEQGRVVGEVGDSERYDYVVLATDVPGSRMVSWLSRATDGVGQKAVEALAGRINQMDVAPAYRVLRVWFDRQLDASRPDVLETPQHRPINLVAQFHQLEDESRDWANRTGGAVLEFHLYANAMWNQIPDRDVWSAIRPVALELFPELAEAKVIATHVNAFENFTSFEVGQASLRPTTDYPSTVGIPNLFLAGDWIRTAYPAALMERAVATGREAANHILLAENVRQADLVVTSGHGPGVI